jgi:hypothetical protein
MTMNVPANVFTPKSVYEKLVRIGEGLRDRAITVVLVVGASTCPSSSLQEKWNA